MSSDELFIRRCFELARLGIGKVSPNPPVGCVIVHKNLVIGEGWHEQYGGAHAEVNAVASVKPSDLHLLRQSTLFVSLEPCSHFGKTPPCVDLVLKHGFPRVVISCGDPNPKVNGRSVQKLKEAGVEVATGILEKEGRWLIRFFSHSMTMRRPYVVLKFAQSKDGFMGQPGKQVWINNQISKRLAHQWRHEIDAIMVGTTTALIDNPTLTNRFWTGRSPLRIVLDRKASLPTNLNIFNDEAKTIAYADQAFIKTHPLREKVYRPLDFGVNMLYDLLQNLQETEKMQSIMVEGGAKLLNSFIEAGLWDEARICTAAHFLEEGNPAPKITGNLISTEKLGSDEWQVVMNSSVTMPPSL